MPFSIFSFAAMGITTWLYCEYLFARKGSALVQAVSFCIGYLALSGAFFSGWGWLSILPFFAVNAFLMRQNYQCATKTAVLHAAFLTFGMVFTQELASLGIADPQWGLPYMPFDTNPDTVLPRQLYYLVLCVLGARCFKPHKQEYREPGRMVLFCSLPILCAVTSMVVLFMEARQEISAWAKTIVTITQAALLAVNLIFFILYNQLQKAHAANLELQLSIQKEQTDTAYYQALKEQWESQRILVHDIKNHLHTLDALAQQSQSRQIRAYLQKLEMSMEPAFRPRLAAEPILDMLLQQIRSECDKKGITFYCDIRSGCTGFMDEPAITALYGNLLSNAVEGAEDSSGRTIELRVTGSEAQGVVISIVNDCDIAPKKDTQGRLVTRKGDPQAHGVGLKSIERILHRYNGIQTVYYDKATHQFHHVIQFPGQTDCEKI